MLVSNIDSNNDNSDPITVHTMATNMTGNHNTHMDICQASNELDDYNYNCDAMTEQNMTTITTTRTDQQQRHEGYVNTALDYFENWNELDDYNDDVNDNDTNYAQVPNDDVVGSNDYVQEEMNDSQIDTLAMYDNAESYLLANWDNFVDV